MHISYLEKKYTFLKLVFNKCARPLINTQPEHTA